MHEIKIEKTTFGNFDYAATGTVSDEVAAILVSAGALQVLQRTPSTDAEKKLAGYGKKRPINFKRTDIPYSEDNAAVLRKYLSAAEITTGEDTTEALDLEITVTEHVSTAADAKLTEERAKYASKTTPESQKALMDTVGYAGEYGDGTVEGAPMELLRAIRKYTTAKAREAMEGI